jgi:F0F1-type ATP synthase assembly protein I
MISQRMGRLLSAVGALLLIGGLFLTWYHIDRANGFVENATGFDTFTRLRLVILAGAVVLLLTAIVAQTQPVLIVRTLVGVVLGILILRRIVFPPDIADPVKSQFGVFVGLVGAVCAVLGGIVDTTREVADRYPEMAFWRPPAGELGAGAPPTQTGARRRPQEPAAGGGVVDSTAEEIR